MINQLYGAYPSVCRSKPDLFDRPSIPSEPEARLVPTHCVDAPPATHQKRRGERAPRVTGPTAPRDAWWHDAAPGTGLPSLSSGRTASRPLSSPGLPPGVVDTRPPGLRMVDIRDGVALQDGVLDTRPHGVALVVDNPPSPFAPPPVPSGAAPSDAAAVAVTPAAVTSAAKRVDAPVAPAGVPVSPYMRRSDLRRLEARAARPAGGLSVPQMGIAGALGLATIAAPLTGALNAPLQAGANRLSGSAVTSAMVIAAPVEAAPAFPRTAPAAANAVEAATVVVGDARSAAVPDVLAAPGQVLVTRASRGGTRAVLPGCDGVVPSSAASAENGRMPASSLCTLWQKDQKLRADAAVDLAKLNVAFTQKFGHSLCVTDSYRTLSEQYTVKALRGWLAARPGTSEHGWGLAIDICGGEDIYGTPTYTWLRANAQRYGWTNPDWALPSGSKFEPWHWEYFRGQDHESGRD